MIGRFETAIEDFNYRPLIVDGRIVRDRVVIEGDIVWVSTKGVRVTVKDGFICNLASLPLSGVLLYKLGRHQRASALHDWLYSVQDMGRSWCDRQLLEACEFDQVTGYRRWMVYAGAVSGGWLAWRNSTEPVLFDAVYEPEFYG